MQQVLRRAGGIRYSTRIPEFLVENLHHLQEGVWENTYTQLERLVHAPTQTAERTAARFLAATYAGI